MSLTTTDSLRGKGKPPMCDECHKRVQRVTFDEMHRQLCDECVPAKLRIGGPVPDGE